MKPMFNKTWLIVSIMIIFNIAVFSFLSKKLEVYVVDNMASSNNQGGM